ncbi:hypothetical protein V493_01264 [Pseudogymnoascus sp. VKM F-4281 (FW-2241)]|nr:hypothetical protein V493_01264 [Pseudogymnoascus sp. VKM F-4281 (FW-2241)]
MSPPNSETTESPSHISPMLRLPPEIIKTIVDQVPNSTIKTLRLTCRFYLEAVALRLDRVFISANPRNVEVFTAIANHEAFRAKITEIIWDDALLYVRPVPRNAVEAYYGLDDGYQDYAEESDECDKNGINWRGNVPGAQQACEQMPMEGAWAYYQQLVQQQRDVLDSNTHIIALEKHIGSFPALQRIAITPAAHGWIYNPLYETPMIRSFPRGFNYYIPRTWPVHDRSMPECDDWNEDGSDWQGFRTVTRVLAEGRDFGRVVDLRIDVHELETGLNSRVFEKENRTLSDFEAVLARPDFAHLQLDLMVDQHYTQADVFRSGLLKRALARASCGQGLKSLSLRTNIDMYTTIDECDCLHAKDSTGIRDTLGWKERERRPTLVVSTDLSNPKPGQALWLEHELYSFLYENGSNPFGNGPATRGPSAIRFGFGWEKDCFNPYHKRPHVDNYDLADLGYIKGSRPRPVARPTQDLPGPENGGF